MSDLDSITPFSNAPEHTRSSDVPVAPIIPDLDDVMPPDSAMARKRRKARELDVVDGRAEYKLVPINDLKEDPDNPRTIYRHIDELAKSLEQVGLEQPVTARISDNGTLTVMYGHRRLRAAKKLHWDYVPTIIKYGVADAGILAQQLTENIHRTDLDPIDEARGIRRLMKQHKLANNQQAAELLGISISWVGARLALLDLNEDEQEAVATKKMTIGQGVAIARERTGTNRTSKKMLEEGRVPVDYHPPVKGKVHFGDEHPLAGRAASRCKGQHQNKVKPQVGGIACGECWEVVIRLDAARKPKYQAS